VIYNSQAVLFILFILRPTLLEVLKYILWKNIKINKTCSVMCRNKPYSEGCCQKWYWMLWNLQLV